MLDEPIITHTSDQLTAIIHLTIPKDQIQHEMGPGIGELMGTVAKQGISPSGPWFTHHLKMSDTEWDFEISVPVPSPVVAEGRVKAGAWPAMKVMQTIYTGPYEGLGEAWGELMDWISQNGYAAKDDLYERYLAGPETGADSSTYRTQLIRPLKS